MALFYEKRKANVNNQDKKVVFYPRAVHKGTVRLQQIANEVAEYSSLTAGDVQNTIENLIRVMGKHMQSSEIVHLDGLGSFRITMNSKGKGVESIDKVSPAQATLTVRFRPELTRNPDRTVATRSMVTGTKCMLFDPKGSTTTDDIDDDTDTGSDNTTPDTGNQGGDNTGTGGDNTGGNQGGGEGDGSMD